MKAILYKSYGSPEVLRCEEVQKPTPGNDEVLIKVRAASVNPLDWHLMRGEPYVMRPMTGFRQPKDPRLGVDLAGEVEAVGTGVTRFQPDDAVFGSSGGAFAEYVCAREKELALKPANLTFEQAAAVAVAGLTALQGLRDRGRVQPGQKVLINGAAGGVGTFAVQIAKSFGADVTGVCGTPNVDMVRSIGADRVVDYTREDFTRSGQQYDLIFDCVGNHSLPRCRRVLTRQGTYIMVAGSRRRWIAPFPRAIAALLLSRFVSQNLFMMLAKISAEDLVVMGKLMQSGQVTPVIDRCYRLSDVPEAIRYLEEGHTRGKVVITVNDDIRTVQPVRKDMQ
jgi:NADPH:quinone reductase-like Zn-dependent oxidoreductase